tara:strand:- start:142 stop:441 length:300 start_codon:yes stop_codon:yes gene_type:complete
MSWPDTKHDEAYTRAFEHIIAARALAEAQGEGLLTELLERLDEDIMTMSREHAALWRTVTSPTYRVERLSASDTVASTVSASLTEATRLTGNSMTEEGE